MEKIGGMVQAVASGYVQREVARQAYEYEKRLQEGKVIKVGVNKYTEGVDMEVELHEYNEAWAQEQISRLKELKRTRDNKAVSDTSQSPGEGRQGEEERDALLVDCCKAYATVGRWRTSSGRCSGSTRSRVFFEEVLPVARLPVGSAREDRKEYPVRIVNELISLSFRPKGEDLPGTEQRFPVALPFEMT